MTKIDVPLEEGGLARRDFLKISSAFGLVATAGMSLPTTVHAQTAGTLRVGLKARDMGILHPHIATGSNDVPVIASIFSGLVRYSPTKVSIESLEPDLAEKWEMSDDYRTHTFHLRKGAQWQKGYGEVTSEDVAYSLDFVRNDPQSTFKPLYSVIEKVETPNPYTVVITLAKPDPTFVTAMANWHGGFILCKKAAEEMGDAYRTEPVGSGPFQFESYSPKENVVLTAHADYFGGKPTLDRVVYSYVPDATARRFAFVQQEFDIIQGATNEAWLAEVSGSTPGNPTVDLLGPVASVVMHMKQSVKPLDDLKVRKAIAYAINREDYEAYFGRVYSQSWSLIPPGYFGAVAKEDLPAELVYDFDPEKAKALLKEAGHEDGFELETVVSERPDYLAFAQIAQERLANVGITLKLNVLDHGSWVAAILKEDRGSLVWSNSSRYPSAEYLIREFYLCSADVTKPTGVQGFAHYCNPDLDAAYEAANETPDVAIRMKEFAKVQTLGLADLPVVPIGTMSTPVLRQGYVEMGYPIPEDAPIVSLPYMYQLSAQTKV